MVQVSADSTSWATQWGKPRSHGLQRVTQYPNPLTKMCCRAMLYDVTQIYDAWYRPQPCCPTSVELQCSRTKLRSKCTHTPTIPSAVVYSTPYATASMSWYRCSTAIGTMI